MDNYAKLEIAKDIINSMIAKLCKNGFDTNSKALLTLLKQQQELQNFNFNTIDKIIDNYSPFIKRGYKCKI